MPQGTNFQNFGNMVNYTNVLTSAANEMYISTTESPDSKAFLMKNTITIDFSFAPIPEDKAPVTGEQSSGLAPTLFLSNTNITLLK